MKMLNSVGSNIAPPAVTAKTFSGWQGSEPLWMVWMKVQARRIWGAWEDASKTQPWAALVGDTVIRTHGALLHEPVLYKHTVLSGGLTQWPAGAEGLGTFHQQSTSEGAQRVSFIPQLHCWSTGWLWIKSLQPLCPRSPARRSEGVHPPSQTALRSLDYNHCRWFWTTVRSNWGSPALCWPHFKPCMLEWACAIAPNPLWIWALWGKYCFWFVYL